MSKGKKLPEMKETSPTYDYYDRCIKRIEELDKNKVGILKLEEILEILKEELTKTN